jgi:hypothetical protein
MLKPAGDLSFTQETPPAVRVVSVSILDALQGHRAVQLGILRQQHFPEVARGVKLNGLIAGRRQPGRGWGRRIRGGR